MGDDYNNEMEVDETDSRLVDVDLCVVCSQGSILKILSDTLAENLSTNLSSFNHEEVLDHQKDVNERLKEILNSGPRKQATENLTKELKQHDYAVHKTCYDKFNKPHLDRAVKGKRRKTEGESSRTTRSQLPPPAEKFAELCLYCGEPAKDDPRHPERSNPLHAAVAHKKDSSHVNEFTDRVRKMPIELGNMKVLNTMERDVRAIQFLYHNGCHTSFKRRYCESIAQKTQDSGDSVSSR